MEKDTVGYRALTHKCIVIGGIMMTLTAKRILILSAIVLIGFVLGRLAVRALMNLLLGGTLFGGNIL